MLQQRALAPGAHAGDLVQRIGADGGAALLAMAADGEAVRLVAQPLQIIENRAFGIEAERLLAGHVEMLAAGIAVRPFGDADQRHILDPQIGEHLAGDGQLARPAVDQHQIGPCHLASSAASASSLTSRAKRRVSTSRIMA